MKRIVNLIPDEVEIALYKLNKEDYIEDPETYKYFVSEIYFKQLDEFIKNNYSSKKGKLKTYEDKEKEIRERKTLLTTESSEGL
ncbi:MAG TPA: hypothetical protein VH878_01685 [Thermodesulfobacteriota bacterium]|jgi:hypothetical protein